MAFIIDSYNKYDIWDREHARKVFEINGNWYAVKEVELKWGIPQLPMRIDRNQEEEGKRMHLYDTLEEAMQFVSIVRGVN